MEERKDIKCKFTVSDSCPIQNIFGREPTEFECIACSLRKIAWEIHPEDGVYHHAVQLIGED
jgi:hypothetical protein